MTSTIDARGPNSGTAALDDKFDVDELVVLSAAILVVLSDGIPNPAEGSVGVISEPVELSLGMPRSVELSEGMEFAESFPARGSPGFAPGSGVWAYANLNNEESLFTRTRLATARIIIANRNADVPIVILLTCLY